MQVHIIKSPEYNHEEFFELFGFLSSFDGPLKFIKNDFCFPYTEFNYLYKNQVLFQIAYDPVTKFDKKPTQQRINSIEFVSETDSLNPALKWNQLFDVCSYFRRTFNIHNEDFVVLLTNKANEWNWFSACDESKNIFVDTNNWEYYVKTNPVYPIAYQIAENILQYLMETGNTLEANPYVHSKARGCVNDFCQDKSEIILKFRTADICDTCVSRILEKQVDQRIVSQLLDIFNGIRTEILFVNRLKLQVQPVELALNEENELIVPSFNNQKIRLSPIWRTLYLFYLINPGGVSLSELQDHTERLVHIYQTIRPGASKSDAAQRIQNLVNPGSNAFSEAKTNINKTLTRLFGETLASYYRIEGERGDPFHIRLPAHLIDIRF